LQPDVLGGRLGLQHRHGLADQGGQVERRAVQLQRGGFQLGEVQDVVDHRMQRLAGVVHQADAPAILVLQSRTLGQQAREPDDAVERRAQFVAHIGQEVGLGAHGDLGVVPRLGQGVFLFLLGGDVTHDVEIAGGLDRPRRAAGRGWIPATASGPGSGACRASAPDARVHPSPSRGTPFP
jgi:hypothetical protein